MKLINADTLYEKTTKLEAQALEQINKYNYKENRDEWVWWSATLTERTAFKYDIFDAPTIKAVPVRKGKWISLDDFRGKYNENGYKCSECGEHSDYEENYCPNCGADMRGADDE